MDLEQLATEVRAIKLEQLMDAAIIGALLRTHPNPAKLQAAWEAVGFQSDDFEGDDLDVFKTRFDHWMEQIVNAGKS